MIMKLDAECDNVVEWHWPSYIRFVAGRTMHKICFSL